MNEGDAGSSTWGMNVGMFQCSSACWQRMYHLPYTPSASHPPALLNQFWLFMWFCTSGWLHRALPDAQPLRDKFGLVRRAPKWMQFSVQCSCAVPYACEQAEMGLNSTWPVPSKHSAVPIISGMIVITSIVLMRIVVLHHYMFLQLLPWCYCHSMLAAKSCKNFSNTANDFACVPGDHDPFRLWHPQ